MDQSEIDPTRDCRRLAELESIFVRSKKLASLEDVPFIVNQIRQGNIVLLDISRLNDGKEKTHLELKRIIERIRGETRGYQADIALVNDTCVIVAPSFVKHCRSIICQALAHWLAKLDTFCDTKGLSIDI
jgi:SepF-like predicted cell division protein (DUF552 family)